jgi:hypothetical protein
VNLENFRRPPREYGILPFWFLNGELAPDEMRFQLKEFREQGMPGIILHGRYGLEMPYIGETYLERIRYAVEEAEKLGLQTWIYDEMNWPSGTADKRVLQARPDLAQRYIECINFTVRGPWFTYLTGADSRYNDFERSTPVAAFAVRMDADGDAHNGRIIDLTPNLSFRDVIPWEAPPGNWRLIYIVEKTADYYIDALDPESTAEFLRLGYEPYARAVNGKLSSQMLGFYTDEPAMHYYLTGGDNPVVPWTKDMFRRFQERNGYNLRPRLPDLFFDASPDSARVRYDFYNTLTDFYSDAFYKQIHEWCLAHDVLFTGHLLYEEWLRRLIRVEGNLFKHYPHMDVIGVDHLYPIIGSRDRPDEHVAMKVGSSAAHHLGSPRLLCESFGGIFMDATMQRMKWIADWEYVLGVNLLNPHGFHYTLEGPRKRDWPPSMFYQYPWWHQYGGFSDYISRLSHLLSGGRHVARVAVVWPIHSAFAEYTPQSRRPVFDRLELDFNVLTDLLLRLHYDFDYLDEDELVQAGLSEGGLRVGDETYELVILPPMTHIRLDSLEKLEAFVQRGGRLLGTVLLPTRAFGEGSQVAGDHGMNGSARLVDISGRVANLFGVDPAETLRCYPTYIDLQVINKDHPQGKASFLRSYALNRQLPLRLQQQLGEPGRTESPAFVIEAEKDASRYFFAPPGGDREEITAEVNAERQAVAVALGEALHGLITADVEIDNPEVFYLHRVNDGQDIYFLVNPTFSIQEAEVSLTGETQPVRWDPSTGEGRPVAPWCFSEGRTRFHITLPPAGSAFILPKPGLSACIIDTNLVIDDISETQITGYGRQREGSVLLEQNGRRNRLSAEAGELPGPLVLEGEWEFQAQDANALVIGKWLARDEAPGTDPASYAGPDADTSSGWLPMVPGAWSYQLPAEPAEAYPIPVWYRIPFQIIDLPPRLEVIVDGFCGSEWQLFLNGQPVETEPVRSAIDSQMQAVDLTDLAQPGENLLAVRLVVTNATDGLLDLVKIMGDFSLEPRGQEYAIAAPQRSLGPAPWTNQGYPFYSGRGVYRRRFSLPEAFLPGEDGRRIFLEPASGDDVLEIFVNGRPAGVRLWPPYTVEITGLLQPGENTLELRAANTLVNLLEATPRLSGLSAAPRLVAYNQFVLNLEA